MRAWHGSQELKDKIVKIMIEHREADALVQGYYLEIDSDSPFGYRGCFVGCVVATSDGGYCESNWHERAETLYGIPASIFRLADTIFEDLPDEDNAHVEFATTVLDVITPGADLSRVADWADRWSLEDGSAEEKAEQLIDHLENATVLEPAQ